MINHTLKSALRSGALALCTTLFAAGCGVAAESPQSSGSSELSESPDLAPKLTCDQFCQSEGGQFFRSTPAGSQAQCTAKGGDWSPTPAPGCCCKCTLASGNCD
jgi:hypothetical protein